MNRIGLTRLLTFGCALVALASPAAAQIELSGVYSTRMYEDSTQRGVRLDEGSISLWERHTRGYLRIRREELAASSP